MSDYPDHLNPFKRSGLRESFRSLKSAIGVRFRKRDSRSKDNASIADSPGSRLRHEGAANGKPMPRSVTMIGATAPEMLPRSRFNERVARAQTMEFGTGGNPFDDEDKPEVNGVVRGKVGEAQVNGGIDLKNGTDTARRRRRKKRAPLPPGARQMLTVPGEHNNSQWSIDSYTSYETDYSTTANTHSENEDGHSDNAERLKDIQEITKEIQVYCDNDNGVPSETNEAVDDKKEISFGDIDQDQQCPDDIPENDNMLPAAAVETSNETPPSQYDEIVDNKIEDIADVENTKAVVDEQDPPATQNNEEEANDNSDQQSGKDEVQSKGEEERIKQSVEEINNNVQDDDAKPTCNGSDSNKVPEVDALKKDTIEIVETTNCDKPEIVESSHVESNSVANSVDNVQDLEQNSKNIAYVDRKSIFIAGSMDNLDVQQNTETTLYITGSCDQLDASEHPKPKIRKNKLSKEIMLGSTGDGLNSASEKK